jgi:hypothetical protein
MAFYVNGIRYVAGASGSRAVTASEREPIATYDEMKALVSSLAVTVTVSGDDAIMTFAPLTGKYLRYVEQHQETNPRKQMFWVYCIKNPKSKICRMSRGSSHDAGLPLHNWSMPQCAINPDTHIPDTDDSDGTFKTVRWANFHVVTLAEARSGRVVFSNGYFSVRHYKRKVKKDAGTKFSATGKGDFTMAIGMANRGMNGGFDCMSLGGDNFYTPL